MRKLSVVTEHPVAFESPDHILPTGTKNDNNTNLEYIEEVESYFGNRKINVMDVGCAGGQLIVDFSSRGHNAVGIEGSDYNSKHSLHNWPRYHKDVLWTADVTKPFSVVDNDGNRVLFDLISAWELVEHIHPSDLEDFFDNVLSNLAPNGIFVAGINQDPDIRRDESGKLICLHQSVFPKEYWEERILKSRKVIPYPFFNKARVCSGSFFIGVRV